jgi:hypothetical protein
VLLLLVASVPVALLVGEALARVQRQARIRALRCLPVTPIIDVAEGDRVRIDGEVLLDGPPLCAPLSGRRCAAYRATIEYHDPRSRRCVVREERADALVVRDRFGGEVRVRAPGRWLVAPEATLRLGVSFVAPSRRVCRFLRRHGLVPHPSLRGAPYAERLSEAVLRQHDHVTLVGVAHWEPDRDYRGAPSLVVVADFQVIKS